MAAWALQDSSYDDENGSHKVFIHRHKSTESLNPRRSLASGYMNLISNATLVSHYITSLLHHHVH